MKFSWKTLAHWQVNAVHKMSLTCELLRYLAALTGGWVWAVAAVAFGRPQLPQRGWKGKVCQTGRHLLHSGGAEKRRKKAKLGSCMERWKEPSFHWSKGKDWGSYEKKRMRRTRRARPWPLRLITSALKRCQSSRSCLVYRHKTKREKHLLHISRQSDSNTCFIFPDITNLVVILRVSHCERRR